MVRRTTFDPGVFTFMSTLEEKLAAIREGAKKRVPEDRRAVMARATEDLRGSGILDTAIKAGASLPPFALRNSRGAMVQSADLLAKGAVVLTVFRGSW